MLSFTLTQLSEGQTTAKTAWGQQKQWTAIRRGKYYGRQQVEELSGSKIKYMYRGWKGGAKIDMNAYQ